MFERLHWFEGTAHLHSRQAVFKSLTVFLSCMHCMQGSIVQHPSPLTLNLQSMERVPKKCVVQSFGRSETISTLTCKQSQTGMPFRRPQRHVVQ
jgi:hypothetical protein